LRLCQAGGFGTLWRGLKIVFGIGKPKNREEHRYYLLPGMGKANRRKRALYLRWAIIAGLFISLIVSVAIYLTQKPGPGLFR
jgi:hypothetical protein